MSGSFYHGCASVARNRVFATIFGERRRYRKKPGFLDCRWVARNRVFVTIFGERRRYRKKPGFLDCRWVARNRVFVTIFGERRRYRKKPGFLDCACRQTAQFSNSYTMLPWALIYLRFVRSQLQSNQYQLPSFRVPVSSEFHQPRHFRHIPLPIISD
jgi:hypothetical protein